MIPLHPFNLPFFSWWRKSYMDLITQDLIPWDAFSFGKNVDHKRLTGLFLDLLDYQKCSWRRMPLHGVPGVPLWPESTPMCSADVCVLTQGRRWPGVLFQAALTSWEYTRWWTAATLSWAWGSAASSVGRKVLGKGGHSLRLPACSWQSSGIEAPGLSRDMAAGL